MSSFRYKRPTLGQDYSYSCVGQQDILILIDDTSDIGDRMRFKMKLDVVSELTQFVYFVPHQFIVRNMQYNINSPINHCYSKRLSRV